MNKDWYIEREIQSKEYERISFPLRKVFEFLENESRKNHKKWHTEMESKIDKNIMAPIDTICRIFIPSRE